MDDFKIMLSKLDNDLLTSISEKRKLPIGEVSRLLYYNIIPIDVLVHISGKPRSTIAAYTYPKTKRNGDVSKPKLDISTPFKFGKHLGMIFIVLDNNCVDFIKKALNITFS